MNIVLILVASGNTVIDVINASTLTEVVIPHETPAHVTANLDKHEQ